MKNKIILLPSRFLFLLAIIIFTACEKVDLDDINTGSEGDNNVNIITRSDSEIQYPLYIIAFDGEGNAVKKTTVETAMGGAYLKQVKKEYMADRTTTDISISNDYLWLLSCGEIWSSGSSSAGT